MTSPTLSPSEQRHSQRGEPTWEVAQCFPTQGNWTVNEYLALDLSGGKLIEFNHGVLEFPPMPIAEHQRILRFLVRILETFLEERGVGEILTAPLPLLLETGLYREPDALIVRPEHLESNPDYPTGAELVIEIVSAGKVARQRDFETKRKEYAATGIPEYWIIDPKNHEVHVLTFQAGLYREHDVVGKGQTITSLVLPGVAISVDALFAAGMPRSARNRKKE